MFGRPGVKVDTLAVVTRCATKQNFVQARPARLLKRHEMRDGRDQSHRSLRVMNE